MAVVHIFLLVVMFLKSQSQTHFNLLNRSVIDLVQVLLI